MGYTSARPAHRAAARAARRRLPGRRVRFRSGRAPRGPDSVERVTLSHLELFQRYMHAGPITRSATAYAALFTDDGVYEAPLEGLRLAGRAAIEQGIVAVQQRPGPEGVLNPGASRFTLHDTADPAVFVTEIDAVYDGPGGSTTVSLVQIFRRDGDSLRELRDYFHS